MKSKSRLPSILLLRQQMPSRPRAGQARCVPCGPAGQLISAVSRPGACMWETGTSVDRCSESPSRSVMRPPPRLPHFASLKTHLFPHHLLLVNAVGYYGEELRPLENEAALSRRPEPTCTHVPGASSATHVLSENTHTYEETQARTFVAAWFSPLLHIGNIPNAHCLKNGYIN